jgi:hypothetical protein
MAITEMAAASRQHTVSHFFTREFLTKRNMIVVPHPTYLSLFHQWNIKLRDDYVGTTEVIQAEPLVVLNTLTEHTFQDAF